MKRAIIIAALALPGCAAPGPRWTSAHPDWNPPQGLEYAIAQCDVKAQETSGYDWVDAALKKGNARAACMKAYGYE